MGGGNPQWEMPRKDAPKVVDTTENDTKAACGGTLLRQAEENFVFPSC